MLKHQFLLIKLLIQLVYHY